MNHFNIPTVFVIFGATGDLMRRKLVPALFHLYKKEQLPTMTRIVAFSRRDIDTDAYRKVAAEFLEEFVHVSRDEAQKFLNLFQYQKGDFQDKESYFSLAKALNAVDEEWGVCSNKLFYLAVPPQFYKEIFNYLAESSLTKPCSDEMGWTRVLVEKPFGSNLKTAQELDALLGTLFQEEQIFRIDHYLAKEAVQNILAIRFSNSIFESSWDGRTVEKIEIKLLEEIGIEGRGLFYDSVGALRDVGQNHMLQMLALIAMNRPASFIADDIRKERTRLLKELQFLSEREVAENTARGQYNGYREEPGVAARSQTETYFRLTAHVENDRWRDVPFYLESGKRLYRSAVEIIVTFRHVEPCLCPKNTHFQNVLYFQLQPNQEISVSFYAKRPGLKMELEEKALLFNYQSTFDRGEFVGAYEKILLDCISGDQTLFTSTEEIAASWKYIDAITEGWSNNAVPLFEYDPGTGGPHDNYSG